MAPPTSIPAAVGDPAWLAHRYDPGQDAVHLLKVPRDTHRRVTFLTDDYLPAGDTPIVIRRADAMAARPQAAPIHFIFHSAYCCSTLLARAVDRPGWAMGLKEPVILNDLVGWRRRGGAVQDIARVLDDSLTLLARPFGAGEAVVVKPSTVANSIAGAMLTVRPQARALLLHAPLATYLASIAKKGIDGRLWVRTMLTGMLDDGLIDLGFTPRDLLGLTDLQVAAVTWLAHQKLFAALVAKFGPDRIRTLDSATLMARPQDSIAALAMLYDRPLDQPAVEEITAGPAFRTHSKSGDRFDVNDRSAEHRDAETIHGDEIDKVARWSDAVAANAGVPVTLAAPLID